MYDKNRLSKTNADKQSSKIPSQDKSEGLSFLTWNMCC